MEKIYLKELLSSKIITSVSNKLRMSKSGYPYVRLYTGTSIMNLYLTKKTAEYAAKLGIKKDQDIKQHILDTSEVLLCKNARDEERYKLSFGVDSDYISLEELSKIFNSPLIKPNFDAIKFMAEFRSLYSATDRSDKSHGQSYAQYNGPSDGYGGHLDDDFIKDALGGDPDAYWNID
jgi:hypothetical protein